MLSLFPSHGQLASYILVHTLHFSSNFYDVFQFWQIICNLCVTSWPFLEQTDCDPEQP